MASNTRMQTLLLSAFAALFAQQTAAQGANCRAANSFNNYNATRSYPMPALTINRTEEEDRGFNARNGAIIENSDDTWYLVSRMYGHNRGTDGATTLLWVNTGDTEEEILEDMGMCFSVTMPFALDKFAFAREVLERSVYDTGDCRTMLGNDCVDALHRHYEAEAISAMTRGECPSGRFLNTTVPWECSGLVNESETWNSGVLSSGVNLTRTLTQFDLSGENCDNTTRPLNSSMHGGGGTGDGYNETIRFPAPWFMYFYPNRSDLTHFESDWTEDVHVEIRCMKPDEVAEGSTVPPSPQELLDREGVEYYANATDPESAASRGLGLAGWAPYLSAAGLAVLLLI